MGLLTDSALQARNVMTGKLNVIPRSKNLVAAMEHMDVCVAILQISVVNQLLTNGAVKQGLHVELQSTNAKVGRIAKMGKQSAMTKSRRFAVVMELMVASVVIPQIIAVNQLTTNGAAKQAQNAEQLMANVTQSLYVMIRLLNVILILSRRVVATQPTVNAVNRQIYAAK